MRTARSSSRRGGGSGPDPPQFPPWVWARIWSPSISLLAVALALIPLNFPPECGPGGGFSLAGFSLAGGGGPPSRGISLAGGLLPGDLLGRGSPWWGPSFLGALLPGGILQGVSFQGCLLLGGGFSFPGDPPLWIEWQTGAKILPCPKLRLRAVKTDIYHPFVYFGTRSVHIRDPSN